MTVTGRRCREAISMKTNLLLIMTVVGVLVFGTSLYGQQEVDPTSYDPWGVADMVAHSSTPEVIQHKQEPKVVSALPEVNQVRSNGIVSMRGRPQLELGVSSPFARSVSISVMPDF